MIDASLFIDVTAAKSTSLRKLLLPLTTVVATGKYVVPRMAALRISVHREGDRRSVVTYVKTDGKFQC